MNKFCDWLSETKVICVRESFFWKMISIVYCHNRPTIKLDHIDRWRPLHTVFPNILRMGKNCLTDGTVSNIYT